MTVLLARISISTVCSGCKSSSMDATGASKSQLSSINTCKSMDEILSSPKSSYNPLRLSCPPTPRARKPSVRLDGKNLIVQLNTDKASPALMKS